jgi:hypothetical protein
VRAPGLVPVAWCPFSLFRPLGLVISYVVINTSLLFISLFVTICVKLDPGTHKGNAFSFSLKIGCDKSGNQSRVDRRTQAWIRMVILKDILFTKLFSKGLVSSLSSFY